METVIPTNTFIYRGESVAGHALSGSVDARDADEARAMLDQMGVRVAELAPADRPRRVWAIGGADFAAFNQQLAHLTQAGLPVEAGLRLIAQEARTPRLRASIRQVAEEIERGRPMGEAFAAHRGQFPSLYGQVIDAGVATHNLPGVLFNLNRHMELAARLRAAVWQALAYPIVVIAGLAAVLLFLSLYVMPQFVEIFTDFDTELPSLTGLVLSAVGWGPPILITVLAAIAALPLVWAALRATGQDAVVADALVLPLPLVGPVLRRNLVARWCDAVRLGVEAGMDLPRAMRLAAQAMGSPSIEQDTGRLVASVEAGRPLSAAGTLSVLPPSVPTAIDLAAPRGNLAEALETLTSLYRQQAELRISTVNVLLTPVLLLIIGVVIGMIVIAMFLPLINVMQSVM